MSCALPVLEGCTITVIIRLIAAPAAAYKVVLGVMMTELLQPSGGKEGCLQCDVRL